MKENSIEEDIKDIKKYISFTSKRENFSHDTDWNWNKDLANKIEHVLSDYKRLLKENEEYSKQLDLDYVDKNYISKQKIKDEIEELKGKLEDISRRREKSKTKEEETVLWCLEIRIDERIKTLQELL